MNLFEIKDTMESLLADARELMDMKLETNDDYTDEDIEVMETILNGAQATIDSLNSAKVFRLIVRGYCAMDGESTYVDEVHADELSAYRSLMDFALEHYADAEEIEERTGVNLEDLDSVSLDDMKTVNDEYLCCSDNYLVKVKEVDMYSTLNFKEVA